MFPTPMMISEPARTFFESANPLPFRSMTASVIEKLRHEARVEAAAGSEWARRAYVETTEVRKIDGISVYETTPKNLQKRDEPTMLLYFFGGGFVVGGPIEDLPIMAGLSHRLGVRCVAPNYRLAPEYAFPYALDDVQTVYRAILEEYEPDRVLIAGESAGGNLGLSLLLRCKSDGLPMPAGVALMSPWSDLSNNGNTTNMAMGFDPTLDYQQHLRSGAEAYIDCADATDPLISPIYGAYDSTFPPILITTGTRDLFLSDCARLSTNLRQAGSDVSLHVWEGMWHVFEFYPDVPESHDSLDEIAQFLGHSLTPKKRQRTSSEGLQRQRG